MFVHASGVTPDEIARPLPGDDLVPDANEVIDRATTLSGDVWPWLVQLGKGRAGWYFPRWAERLVLPSRRGLRHLEPALQRLAVGDEHADWGPGDPVLRVAVLDPPHTLVYHSLRDARAGHRWPADGSAAHPEVFAMSWALAHTGDRLHLRLRMRTRSRALAAVGGVFDWVTVELLFAGPAGARVTTTWTAPVRYGECDQQGIVFNSHYLLYCDEAMGAFCAQRGLGEFMEIVRLVASSLVWTAPARWGDVIEVSARCAGVGTTSARMQFAVAASGRPCCTVETTYVYADRDGVKQPLTEDLRARLLG